MRNDVQLLGDDRGRNALMPELMSVFKAVQDQGPMHRAQQIYFNAWILHALLHYDTNTFLTLQARPVIATTLAFRHAQYAFMGDYHMLFDGVSEDDLDSKIHNIRNVLGVFRNRMDTAQLNIPFDMRRIAKVAIAFNDELQQRRASLIQGRAKDAAAADILVARKAEGNPLIAASMASYLMHIIGQHLRAGKENGYVQEKYSSHTEILNAVIPSSFDMRQAGEAICMDAVNVLRDIHKRIDEILWDKSPSFMPQDKPEIMKLLLNIGSITQAYARAKKPEEVPVSSSTPNNVISLFGARTPH